MPNVANLALKLIHKYCKNIRNFDIEISKELNPSEISNEMLSIASKLKSLHIRIAEHAPHALAYDLISACIDIEELGVYGIPPCGFCMQEDSFEHLRIFKANNVSCGRFFEQNCQLEEIEVNGYSREVIRFICRNMLNLKKLKLSGCNSARRIEGLRDLNEATINLDGILCDNNIHRIHHLQNITEIRLEILLNTQSRNNQN